MRDFYIKFIKKNIYDGHEVTVHTLTHPHLTEIDNDNEVLKPFVLKVSETGKKVGYKRLNG